MAKLKKDVVIKVEKLSKRYSIGRREQYLTLRDRLVELPKTIFKRGKKKQDFWALKNVSFELKRGEVLGIIGRNGAGKSTLLKILSRITEPTNGKVTMRGRVASMLEVGTGFNPELTGRENIYLNGAILGMGKTEIRAKFDEIVEFSGIDKFLDTPVKRYSSGMYVRLAFSVAAYLDSDILLVDEVLSVGDQEFQNKCLGKMNSLSKSGKTVVFVSHNIASIKNLCSQAICLEEGRLGNSGSIDQCLRYYLSNIDYKTNFNLSMASRTGSGAILISKIAFKQDEKLQSNLTIVNGKDLIMEITLINKLHEEIDINLSLGLNNQYSQRIALLSTKLTGKQIHLTSKKEQIVYLTIPNIPLVTGRYSLSMFMESRGNIFDWLKHSTDIQVVGGEYFPSRKEYKENGDILISHTFSTHG